MQNRIPTFAKVRDVLARQFVEAETHWCGDGDTLAFGEILDQWPEIAESGQSFPRRWAQMAVYMLDHIRLSCLPAHLFLYRMDWRATNGWDGGMMHVRNKISARLGEVANIFGDYSAGHRAGAACGYTDFSHTCPDWRNVLHLGFPGLLTRIRDAKSAKEAAGTLTEDQREHYESTELVLCAVLRLLRRFAECARQAGSPTMDKAADIMDQLAIGAPRNTWEALELMLFYYFLQNHIDGVTLRSCGRLDALLRPFVERDIANGTFTKDEIIELLKYWMYTFSCANITANMPFSLGGVDRDGHDSYCQLTDWIIDAYGELHEISPKIHILVTPDTPEPLLRKVCDLVRRGMSSFVFMGDETVTKSLMAVGRNLADARDYVLIGCYEPVTMGKEMACTTAGTINLLKAVEYALFSGYDHVVGAQVGAATPPVSEMTTFADFYDAVQEQIIYLCKRTCDYVNLRETLYPYLVSAPLISATFDGCVDAGQAVYFGGTPYNNSSICTYGLATAADAVEAVRQAVFAEKRITLPQLAETLLQNWEGEELLRQRIQKTYPKFGNGIESVDTLARELSSLAMDTINNRPNGRGGVFRTGLFSIDWFIGAGRTSLASPDGRLRGEPISKNLCAGMGQDKNGVTSLLLSAASLEHDKCADGNVLDLMLHKTAVAGEDGLTAMTSLIHAYLANGGYGIQMNVFDGEILRQAQEKPADFETLQVRLCGWNAYFTTLSKPLQEDLIRRTEQ